MPDEAAFDLAMDVFEEMRRDAKVHTESDWVVFEFSSGGDEYQFHVNLWSGAIVLEQVNPYEVVFENRR